MTILELCTPLSTATMLAVPTCKGTPWPDHTTPLKRRRALDASHPGKENLETCRLILIVDGVEQDKSINCVIRTSMMEIVWPAATAAISWCATEQYGVSSSEAAFADGRMASNRAQTCTEQVTSATGLSISTARPACYLFNATVGTYNYAEKVYLILVQMHSMRSSITESRAYAGGEQAHCSGH